MECQQDIGGGSHVLLGGYVGEAYLGSGRFFATTRWSKLGGFAGTAFRA